MNLDALLILIFLIGLPFFLYSRSPRYKRLHQKRKPEFSESKTKIGRIQKSGNKGGNLARTVAIASIPIIFFLGQYFYFQSSVNYGSTGVESSETIPSPSSGLELIEGSTECSYKFCQFWALKLIHTGDNPVRVSGEFCVIADGKRYSENFDKRITETMNPEEELFFDASFRLPEGARVEEIFIGDCVQGSQIVSLQLEEKVAS